MISNDIKFAKTYAGSQALSKLQQRYDELKTKKGRQTDPVGAPVARVP
jgi:hypothetical protein